MYHLEQGAQALDSKLYIFSKQGRKSDDLTKNVY